MLNLIEKRQALDIFLEHLLYESDSPTHLLNFVDDATWVGTSPSCDCPCSVAPDRDAFTRTAAP
jgi:hypothetical protein